MNGANISYISFTNGRGEARPFGIRQADRLYHMYLVGKTGTGKSTLLRTLAEQDMLAGRGFCFIDPHGDTAESLAATGREAGLTNAVYWNVPDPTCPFGYNPLRHVRKDKIPLAASGILEAFKKLWEDAWGVRMEHILRYALYALLEVPNSTLPDILRLLTDDTYRRYTTKFITNPQVRTFWEKEYPSAPIP